MVKVMVDSGDSFSSWSDPRDASAMACAAEEQQQHPEDGIAIPAFLQPLLGVDFVPYLPRPTTTTAVRSTTTTTTATTTTATSRLTDDDLVCMDLLIQPPVDGNYENSTSYLTPTARSESDLVMLEALRPPTTGQSSKEPVQVSTNTSNRKGWMTRVRGKMDGRRDRRRSTTCTSLPGDDDNNNNNSKVLSPQKLRRAYKKNIDDGALEWLQVQNLRLAEHQSQLSNIQMEAQIMKTQAAEIQQRIGETQKEVTRLHKAMIAAETKMRRDREDFDQTQQQLVQLQRGALLASQAVVDYLQQMQDVDLSDGQSGEERRSPSQSSISSDTSLGGDSYGMPVEPPNNDSSSATPLRPRASTAPSSIRVDSFMRVDDLDILDKDVDNEEPSSTTEANRKGQNPHKANGLIFLDNHIVPILEKLSKLGYSLAVDESDRFVPTKDTEKLLGKYAASVFDDNYVGDWSVQPWKAAHGNDILIWTGDIGHSGFGSDWPVVKARCLVKTSPRILVEFMMDSSKIKEYNKMSQGREDLVRIQEGLDTTAAESFFGFGGDCKIIKSLTKPRLLPKAIETVSLMYSKPLEIAAGSFMIVTRSVFEDSSGEHKSSVSNAIRTETLIGVMLFRPANREESLTEFTSITHVFSPGVPEMLARRAAPGSAYGVLKEIQSAFAKSP